MKFVKLFSDLFRQSGHRRIPASASISDILAKQDIHESL